MNPNDYLDPMLPELLHVIEQVRLHILQQAKCTGTAACTGTVYGPTR